MNQHARMLEAFALADAAAYELRAAEADLASVQGAEDLRRRALLLRGQVETLRDAIDHERTLLFPMPEARAAS